MKIFLSVLDEDLKEQFLHTFKTTSHKIITHKDDVDDTVQFAIIEGVPEKSKTNTLWISDPNPMYNTIQFPFSVKSVVNSIVDVVGEVTENTGLRIDLKSHQVFDGTRETKLTGKEFAVLIFIKNANGAIVDRATLLEEVWGMSSDADKRTVDVVMTRLRGKLGFEHAAHIQTVSGSGYRWKTL